MRRKSEMEVRNHSTVQARGRHSSDSSLGTSSGSGYEERPHPSRINMGDSKVLLSPSDDGTASSKGLQGYTIPKLVKSTPNTESAHPGNGIHRTNFGSTPSTQFRRSCSASTSGRVQRSRKRKQCFCGSDTSTPKKSVKSNKPSAQQCHYTSDDHNHSVPGHLPMQKHTERNALTQTSADIGRNVTSRSPPVQAQTDFRHHVNAHRPPGLKAIQAEENFFDSVSAKPVETVPPDGHTSDLGGGNSSSNSLTKFSFTRLRSWQISDSDTPNTESTEKLPLTDPASQPELRQLDGKPYVLNHIECGQTKHNQLHMAQSNPEASSSRGDNFKSVIRKALDMYFDQGKITNRQYKRILERATKRVREGLKICSLNEKQVIKLVADYVKAYRSCALQVT